MSNFDLQAPIYVAGHHGMVGSAIVRALRAAGAANLVTRPSAELDLRDQNATFAFLEEVRPKYVMIAAAKVGGIKANATRRGEFLYDNLAIELNLIEGARRVDVEKLLFLGSSCIYPRLADQPIPEEALLTGPLEPTNEPYAVAKIAGVKLCDAYRHQYGCNFISAMPTNLYGPGDNYDLGSGHVLPALVRKIVTAKVLAERSVTLWGTGAPLREFMHADDLATACLHLMHHYDEAGHVNIGTGAEISIINLTRLIARVFDYHGALLTDPSYPDGTPRKLLDSSKLRRLGFEANRTLEAGLLSLKAEIVELPWYRDLLAFARN